MPSPVEGWDLERYRRVLRDRASRLKSDARVRVRFDESDLTNETLLHALRARRVPEGLADDHTRLAWLAVIQDHVLIDLYRKHTAGVRSVRREQGLSALRRALEESSIDQAQLLVDPTASPSERAERREMERLADDAIARLGSPQADVLRLRRRGWTFEEIAAELGLTVNAAAGQYYRGLKKLKDLLPPDQTS
jgi:RNA polymerase sigma factor (sigma-70 family)